MKDVSDWIDAGGTREQLLELVRKTPLWSPATSDDGQIVVPNSSGYKGTTNFEDLISVGDLLRREPEQYDWLVEDTLPTSGTSLIVAKPKVGKTKLCMNLAVSVATGQPFLGRATKQGPVLYLALEEKSSEVQRAFGALGAGDDTYIHIHIGRAPDKTMPWLEWAVERYKPVLIIVDTLQRLVRLPDMNDYAAVTIRLEPVTNLARQCGAHLAMTHHGKKSGGDHGDAALGSTGLFGNVDTLIELRRGERYRTARSFQRYGTDLDEMVLHMDQDTFRISLDGTRKEADEKHATTQIHQYLSASGPARRNDITDNVEGRQAVKVDALKKAIQEGRVVKTGSGKKGDPILYAIAGSPDQEVKALEDEEEEESVLRENSEIVVPISPGYKSTTIFEGPEGLDGPVVTGAEVDVKSADGDEREYSLDVEEDCSECDGRDPQCWLCTPLATPADGRPNGLNGDRCGCGRLYIILGNGIRRCDKCGTDAGEAEGEV